MAFFRNKDKLGENKAKSLTKYIKIGKNKGKQAIFGISDPSLPKKRNLFPHFSLAPHRTPSLEMKYETRKPQQ